MFWFVYRIILTSKNLFSDSRVSPCPWKDKIGEGCTGQWLAREQLSLCFRTVYILVSTSPKRYHPQPTRSNPEQYYPLHSTKVIQEICIKVLLKFICRNFKMLPKKVPTPFFLTATSLSHSQLRHSWGDSLTNPMLITVFVIRLLPGDL